MTVVLSGNALTFVGDGVQDLFDFNFRIFKAEDLCAVVRNSLGNEKRLVSGSDFKIVSGLGDEAGGRVQYPVSGEPLASGENLTLYREIPYTQELELVDNDPFSAQLLNEAFDRGVMRDQQLQEQLDRALKYEISTPGEERLSPQEMVQTITSACDDAVSARSGAIEAEGIARDLFDEAQAARLGSESARDKAEDARDAAEQARDTAIKISIGDISALRSPAPVLAGPVEAPEGMTVSIVISDYLEDDSTSYEVDTDGFGTAVVLGDVIKWTLDTVDGDVSKILKVVRRRRGELYSDTANHQLFVKKVEVQDGPTMVFADSVEGYPGAIVDADGVHSPAHSVGADNAKQVTSAKPEIIQSSGKLTLLESSATVIKTQEIVEEGEPLFIVGNGYAKRGVAGAVVDTSIEQTLLQYYTGSDQYSQTISDYIGFKLVANCPSFKTMKVRSTVAASGVSIKLGIFNADQSKQIGDWGELQSADGPTLVEVPFAENSVEPGETYWLILAVSGAYFKFGLQNASKPSTILDILKGDTLPLTGTTVNYKPAIDLIGIDGEYTTDISSASLTSAPLSCHKTNVALKAGAGATGEYLGPRKVLNMPKAVVETAQTTSTAEGADTVIGDVIIPAGVTVTKLGAKMAVALSSGGKIAIVKTSDGEHYTVAAIADYTNTGAMTMQYVSLASSFVVPNDGYTYRIACYRSSGNNTVFMDDTSDYFCRSTGALSSVGDTITAITTKYGAITGYERISPTPSTATKIVIETAESIKNNIYVAGGFHNRIEVDGQLYEVESVSEIENNGVYTTTITLENALPEVPTADTVIAIPDRCTLSPANYTITPDGDDIKITGEEIVLEDNPDIKRLAMAVSGPEGMTFKGGKIYIKEES